jgi:hypothetical protein
MLNNSNFENTNGTHIQNSKLRGEWAELRFMTRAAEHGIMVSRPWGDSAPYDLMLERNGRVLLVQVKSTMRIVRGIYRCHVPYARANGETSVPPVPGRRPASRHSQIDFVAAYIIPEDLWYILPAPIVIGLSGHISLSPHRKGHKYEPYQEAWHLLL